MIGVGAAAAGAVVMSVSGPPGRPGLTPGGEAITRGGVVWTMAALGGGAWMLTRVPVGE